MKLVYTNVARDDIRDIVLYLKSIETSFAERFLNELDIKKSMLIMFPLSGSKVLTPSLKLEYRFIRLKGYILIYTINKTFECIEVSRVLSEYANWKHLIR